MYKGYEGSVEVLFPEHKPYEVQDVYTKILQVEIEPDPVTGDKRYWAIGAASSTVNAITKLPQVRFSGITANGGYRKINDGNNQYRIHDLFMEKHKISIEPENWRVTPADVAIDIDFAQENDCSMNIPLHEIFGSNLINTCGYLELTVPDYSCKPTMLALPFKDSVAPFKAMRTSIDYFNLDRVTTFDGTGNDLQKFISNFILDEPGQRTKLVVFPTNLGVNLFPKYTDRHLTQLIELGGFGRKDAISPMISYFNGEEKLVNIGDLYADNNEFCTVKAYGVGGQSYSLLRALGVGHETDITDAAVYLKELLGAELPKQISCGTIRISDISPKSDICNPFKVSSVVFDGLPKLHYAVNGVEHSVGVTDIGGDTTSKLLKLLTDNKGELLFNINGKSSFVYDDANKEIRAIRPSDFEDGDVVEPKLIKLELFKAAYDPQDVFNYIFPDRQRITIYSEAYGDIFGTPDEDYQLIVTSEDTADGNSEFRIELTNVLPGWKIHQNGVLLADETTESSEYLNIYSEDGNVNLTFYQLRGTRIGLDVLATADSMRVYSEWTNDSAPTPRLIEFNKFADNIPWQKFTTWNAEVTAPINLPKHVTNINQMFEDCYRFKGDVSNWDMTHITSLSRTFSNCPLFNSDVSKWDVSNVTDMERTFAGCGLFNSDLSNWNVANVVNFESMFHGATKFNSDLSRWNTSSAVNMREMFRGISSFTSIIENWNVSNVTNMDYMFQPIAGEPTGLPAQDLSKWCVRNIYFKPAQFILDGDEWKGTYPIWGTCPGSFSD